MMDDGKVTITIEIDAELLAQVTEVLKSYGLTPEEAAVQRNACLEWLKDRLR